MRYEFSTRTKKAALEAAGGVCMAVGTIYGLEPETRCTTILVAGNHEYDHWPIPATDDGSDTVENCMVVCKVHHRIKTSAYDVPMQAKGRRIRRANGPPELRRKTKSIPSPKAPMVSRGFDKTRRKKFNGAVEKR